MIRVLQILLLTLPLSIKIIRLFVGTSSEQREELVAALDRAAKKAIDEKDPSELSRLLNR